MRVKQLWVVAVGFSLLLSAPAWAHSKGGETARGKQKDERRDSSIRLTTTKRAELSVLSQRCGDDPPALSLSKDDRDDERASKSRGFAGGLPPGLQKNGLPPGLQKNGLPPGLEKRVLAGLPPGLEKKVGEIRSDGQVPRVNPSVAADVPIPEPSAALFFGVGLIVVRRAIGRTWR